MFWTIEGKRRGIKTLEDIPVMFFVFEFVGEIVTNSEMALHNKTYVECKKHAYNMVLNANEAMENILND